MVAEDPEIRPAVANRDTGEETTALLQNTTTTSYTEDTTTPNEEPVESGAETDIEANQINEADDHKFFTRRFWWFAALGVAALIVLQLTFLPRTSLSRDYRRYHGIHLTKSEVKRNFLVYSGIGNSHNSLTTEQYIHGWLKNFTQINSKSPTNLLSDDNIELVSFIESRFKQFGFKTKSYSYDFSDLGSPVSSEIKLIDSKNRQVIYNANLLEPKFTTPAFHDFGIGGKVVSDFVFANEGTLDDYQLLLANGIDITGKVVIVKSVLNSRISVAEKVLIAEEYGASAFINYFDFDSNNNKENEKYLDSAISRSNIGHGPIEEFKRPSIVAIPISYKAVKPILGVFSEETNNSAFEKWDFHPQKSTKTIKISVSTEFNTGKPKKATNIVGTIKGIMNDGDIIIGAKRDSLTSSNPLSNHAILFEIMRNYQRLVKLGWKPLRNIKFVSWDGSSSGLIGSQLYVNDTNAFDSRHSVLSYINIDSDCIMGSKFHVDANPFFNHLLRQTSKYVPIPRKSASYKTLPESGDDTHSRDTQEQVFLSSIEDDLDEGDQEDPDYEDDEGSYTTLHRYWVKQDNSTINNILGQQLINSDALTFQNHLNVPVVNIRFDNEPKRDSSIYIPNSNYYSLDWLIDRHIDNDLLLHGSLIRYIGLLGISLSEHEVVDYKSRSYFKHIRRYFKSFLADNSETLDSWQHKEVSSYLISKWSIYKDLQKTEPNLEVVRLSHLVHQVKSLVKEVYNNTIATDQYNSHVEDNLIKDYPWYNYYKKLGHLSQFKLANYKLLHWERELRLTTKDFQYLGIDETYYKNVIYGVPVFSIDKNNTYLNDRFNLSTFTGIRESTHHKDYEQTVKWLVIIYEKLRNVNWLL